MVSAPSRRRRVAPALFAVLAVPLGGGVFATSSCGTGGRAPPLDTPSFPTGLALHNDGRHLAVISSDFDKTYRNGSVLLADIDVVDNALQKPEDVADDAYVAGVEVPPFGDRAVFDPTGRHLLFSTRADNLLNAVDVDVDAPSVSCVAACGQSPDALQLSGNDPFDVLFFEHSVDADGGLVSARGLVTHLSSNEAEVFVLEPGAEPARQLRREVNVVNFGNVFGVRSAVLRDGAAAVDGREARDQRIFATLELRVGSTVVGAQLVSFATFGAERAGDVQNELAGVDLTAVTGALSVRDVLVVPGALSPDGKDAVVVALRGPDALARFTFDERSGFLTLSALEETCIEPTGLALIDDVDAPRLLLTCQSGQTIQAIDPLTLTVTDSVRFLGRSPYDVVVTPQALVDAGRPPLAFVSFFLDDSIGVLRFADDDGTPRLSARGRIGTQKPRPEDGRE